MKFLLKYASRSRPALFMKRVCNWSNYSSGIHSLHWLCTFDEDDETMNNKDIIQWCQEQNIAHYFGKHIGKVDAINADMDKAPDDYDIVIIVSDDMACIQLDWDDTVVQDMLDTFPDLDGALWYPDGIQNNICTLSIMGRPVYEELGCLYNPVFRSVYCDNYYHEVMVRSNRMQRISKPVFKHEWREENNDALMTRNETPSLYERDSASFKRMMTFVEKHMPLQP